MKIQTSKSQESSESHIRSLRSDDGTVLYKLLKVESGVYVERVQKRPVYPRCSRHRDFKTKKVFCSG